MKPKNASNFCGFIARKIGPKIPVSNLARKNLLFMDPNITVQKRELIIEEMWENLGRVFGEMPHIHSMSKAEFNKLIKFDGIGTLDKIKKIDRPVIFFSGHIGNWEVMPRIAADNGFDMSLIYRHANNQIIDEIIAKERRKNNVKVIRKKRGAKEMMQIMRNNKAIAMLVDQKMNEGIKVPFFGRDAMTTHAIAKFALKYNALLVPARSIRKKDGSLEVEVFDPLNFQNTGNEEQDIYNIMLNINHLFEEWIKEYPSDWFWVHNRWGIKK